MSSIRGGYNYCASSRKCVLRAHFLVTPRCCFFVDSRYKWEPIERSREERSTRSGEGLSNSRRDV